MIAQVVPWNDRFANVLKELSVVVPMLDCLEGRGHAVVELLILFRELLTRGKTQHFWFRFLPFFVVLLLVTAVVVGVVATIERFWTFGAIVDVDFVGQDSIPLFVLILGGIRINQNGSAATADGEIVRIGLGLWFLMDTISTVASLMMMLSEGAVENIVENAKADGTALMSTALVIIVVMMQSQR
jgi:hypothetical protein